MSTEPGQVRARTSSPEAERMRLYRKRRREAMRYVRIPLHVTEVDALIRIGRLKEDSRTDAEESWSRKSEQGDKWSFCLTAGTLCPANQERP